MTRKLQSTKEGPTWVESYELSKTLRWCKCLINSIAKKFAKIQYFKFYYSFNNFGRLFPGASMNFGEQIWCILSEEMSFKTFTPIWSHVSEMKKKIGKNPKFQISQFFEHIW